jgi:hypothetical protein
MKTQSPAYSLADCAHRVREILAEHDARFVAVSVSTPQPLYGYGQTSYAALCDAVGDNCASHMTARASYSCLPYSWDENFMRDTFRMTDEAGNMLAIFVRA